MERRLLRFLEGPPSRQMERQESTTLTGADAPRYFCPIQDLAGYQVKRKGGWDTAWWPVELQVEKETWHHETRILEKKISIEGIKPQVQGNGMRFKKNEMGRLTEEIGYWGVWDDPYITFEPKYSRSPLGLLKRLYDKGWFIRAIYYTASILQRQGRFVFARTQINRVPYKDVKDPLRSQRSLKLKGEENTTS